MPDDAPALAPAQVTRSVDLDADIDDVWRAVADPAERASWLDDPDARAREMRVDERRPNERLVWTWWHPGDEDAASTVSLVLSPVDGGGTRVVVTESRPALPRVRMDARTQARTGGDGWGWRLLGLELRFVSARAGVA